MKCEVYAELLDKALLFAAEHTDEYGRMVVDGEIDTKDSGWIVLGGVLRAVKYGWTLGQYCLKDLCRRWTLASVRVDDVKSAWTTFSLLLCLEYAKEEFKNLFSPKEYGELAKFFRQIDMRFLLEASRNYRVCAAVIDILRVRHGFCSEYSANPDECIEYMLAGYLGSGFFNDDDGRGDGRDKRIDAYSGEIIGLLLHYDEVCGWQSKQHDRIMAVLRDYCESTLPLIDADGEFAKWGRSLRGEAELKKIMLWEYAQKNGLTKYGDAATARMLDFSRKYGIREDGKIGRDKAFDIGIWDAYTTHVQAQGYGLYGLAFAMRFASGKFAPEPLPSATEDYVKFLPGPDIFCGNDHRTGMHYILPAGNRLTKNMFYWHNRITGEDDVEVDVSAKFMPLPYVGHKIPAPYDGPTVPFLPMLLLKDGTRLIPRNLDPAFKLGKNSVEQLFSFCAPKSYATVIPLNCRAVTRCYANCLEFEFAFEGEFPQGAEIQIHLFKPTDSLIQPKTAFSAKPLGEADMDFEPSIYGRKSRARVVRFAPGSNLKYTFGW